MAGKGSVKVDGARRLRRDLKKAGDDLSDLKAVHASVASYVAQVAAARTPRRTGRLSSTVRGNRAASKAVVMAGRASVPYAIYVHWGTVSQSRQPWVSEAAVDSEPRWTAVYSDGIQRITDRVRGA